LVESTWQGTLQDFPKSGVGMMGQEGVGLVKEAYREVEDSR
jgi:hypothetical protein